MTIAEQKSESVLTAKKGKVKNDWHNSTSEEVPKEVREEVFQVLDEFRKNLESILNH